MKRRAFLQCGLAATLSAPFLAAIRQERLDEAAKLLAGAVDRGQVTSASLCVIQREASFRRHFGAAANADAMFLLGSISKPICVAALMTLYDRGDFRLDDRLSKFLPEFRGDQRERVTIRHLLTHVSGLPDQVAENNALRKGHAELKSFVDHAIRTPLQFEPGTKHQYSSMGILLATHVAERITGVEIREFVDRAVFQPLKMKRSAQGLGRFRLDDFEKCQTEFGAPEAGAGDPQAREWDWNSAYWRKLGAPWGGTHASASDVAAFLGDFLNRAEFW